eukprot:918833-Lingulodinium_polyedra.AAC.1
MTNSPEIAKIMKRLCRGRTQEGIYEARKSAEYADEVYREIARGMTAQMKKDGRTIQEGIGC